ncbi:MAG: MiaB/RimO family radical SAM methylthiotransferase [Deltaproteobacteria bacterium]|nr:MiaB/RimO family radical SAM methylthiotransferase [Deltaproteobacteria bacterium]
MIAETLKFYIKTYGCQMNFHDSSLLEESLIFKGFKKAASLNDANIIILNTCSVRDNADHKIMSDIGRIDKNKKIILAGCYAQQKIKQNINLNKNKKIKQAKELDPKELHINYYVSPENILSIPDMLEKEFKILFNNVNNNIIRNNKNNNSDNYIYNYIYNKIKNNTDNNAIACDFADGKADINNKNIENLYTNKFKNESYYKRIEKSFNLRSEKKGGLNYTEYLKITEGCDNYCSYCIVPYVRGREKSIPLNILLNTVAKYTKKNVQEIVLLGQNVNSYKSPDNPDYNFIYLLKKIAENKNIKRIKFLTSHPKDMSDEVIDLIGKENKISKCLHLPVQSGSDRILKLMNRGYDRNHYLNLIKKIKSSYPEILLSTDIIVGFPGESEEDFELTLSLLKEIEFEFIYGFNYSPRPFTAALNYKDDVPLNIKKERLNKLFDLQKNIFTLSLNKLIGKNYDVIIEKIRGNDDYNSEIINKGIFYKGTTLNERVVYLKNYELNLDNFENNAAIVKITEVINNKLYGEII